MTITLLFCAFSLLFLIQGISKYHRMEMDIHGDQRSEKTFVEEMQFYPSGDIRTFLRMCPPPGSPFFLKSGICLDLIAVINKVEGEEISYGQNLSGIYDNSAFVDFDFSKFLFMGGTLLLLFFGADTFKPRNFYRTVNCHVQLWKIYIYSLLSRYIISLSIFLVLMGLGVGIALYTSVPLGLPDYLQLLRFVCLWALTSFFFLVLGTLIGFLPWRSSINMVLVVVWFLQISLLPFIASVLDNKPVISNKTITNEQLVKARIDRMERIFLFTPGTTYVLMSSKMSGHSHVDRYNFARFAQMRQDEYRNVYGSIQNQVYYGESLMPAHFLRGLFIIFLYVLATLATGFYLFRRTFIKPSLLGYHKLKPDPFRLDVRADDYAVYAVKTPEVVEFVYSRLLHNHPGQLNFVCGPKDFPEDLKVIHILKLLTTCAGHDGAEQLKTLKHILPIKVEELRPFYHLRLLMELAKLKESKIYIFYNTVVQMVATETQAFRRFTMALQESGKSIVYLTTDPEVRSKDTGEPQVIQRSENWPDLVDYLEQLDRPKPPTLFE